MTNKEIAAAFNLTAKLMELHGENEFRIRSYRNAYNALRKFEQPLSELNDDDISAIKGIGKSSVEKIRELLDSGKMSRLESYKAKTPEGVVEMLGIRGVGPSKVRTIWKDMGIESPGELLYACNENRLIEASGFGLKTQADIKSKIEYYQSSKDKWLYARLEPAVDDILKGLRTHSAEADVAGEYARKCNVIHSLEFVAAELDVEAFISNEKIASDGQVFVYDGTLKFEVVMCNESDYVRELFRATGDTEFVAGFDLKGPYSSEEEIFNASGKPFVIPEMRDREGAVDVAVATADYVTEDKLKGILHNHSTYSDGIHELSEIATYVRDAGYEYFGISDHSKSAVYANGLSVDRIVQQHAEIDALNAGLAPFRIFKGIESDILADGSLDYEDDVLATFDFVVASVHSGLKMDEAKATKRLINAIENPYTDILGHPTGRLLLAREGYPIDHMAVIDACADNGVAIELNANPLRLDMDHTWIPYAMEKGVMIAINPDAHSKEGIHNVRFGVYSARKGGLTTKMCLNALSASDFAAWLASRRQS